MPDLRPPVLRDLVRLASDRDASAAALADGTRFRPLPCVLRSGPALVAADDLLARGERSLRSLLEHLSAAVLDERTWRALDPERRTLLDVDEPADLDRLRG